LRKNSELGATTADYHIRSEATATALHSAPQSDTQIAKRVAGEEVVLIAEIADG
jgi:hypothetical protein